MDVKAMAKSKRSHSQHHSKKSYPKPTAKANVDTTAASKTEESLKRTSDKNVAVKKSLRSRGAELPSNSDRYLDEDELDSVDLLGRNDVVKPKSKGADYKHLISEARSQTHSTDYMDVYSSLDDFLPGLNHGFGDMLSVRGEAILSWAGADYFSVEDKARPGYEASFLSLNLNTLNEQLAKVDLAQRLFIEPDVLPPELRPQYSDLKDERIEQFQNFYEDKSSKTGPGTAEFPQPNVEDESVLKEVVVASIDNDDDMDEANENKSNILPDAHKSLSSFEALQAEAELDMLLDSLGGTDVPHSSQIPTGKLHNATGNPLCLNSNMMNNAPSLDDSIDDLLNSTSNVTHISPGLDDAIDDLLDTMSYPTVQDITRKSSSVATNDAETSKSLPSGSNAKLEDDFDSWLETL